MSSGPIANCSILGFSYVVPLLAFFRAHGRWSQWALSICYVMVKKWAFTLASQAHALKCTHMRRGWEYITLDLVGFFFFFLNRGAPILKEVAVVLLLPLHTPSNVGISYYLFPIYPSSSAFNNRILQNLNHQPPELIFFIIKSWFCKMRKKEEKKKLFLGSVRREKRKKVKKPP